jgi:hypothetical protein
MSWQTADFVATLTQTFMTKWRADKVASIGYPFSADVIPFAYNRFSPSFRDQPCSFDRSSWKFRSLRISKSRAADGWANRPVPRYFRCCRKQPKFRRI